jgi:pimeloyl-ACP methyl ester carboxylesterase
MGQRCREATSEAKKKYELTDENLSEAEARMLSFSGLPADQIQQKNIVIGEFKGEDVYIHTLILGDENPDKPVMVLCHGYGGSGALFYKIMKPLTEKFRLIFIDLLGMGGSSRPQNFDDAKLTPQEALDYFTDSIEAWRNAMKLDQFYLAAHSFGGFVCGNYAHKYPQHIKKLLMLSPIGVRYDPEYEA